MNVAALIAWLVTALGGFYLLGKWLAGGGARQQHGGPGRFPVPVIFGHFLLAAAGLIVWIVFLLAHTKALAWTAFVILVPVALLGFTMFFRWIGGSRRAAPARPRRPGPRRAGRHHPRPRPAGRPRCLTDRGLSVNLTYVSPHGTAFLRGPDGPAPLVERAVDLARREGFAHSCRPEHGRLPYALAAAARTPGETGTARHRRGRAPGTAADARPAPPRTRARRRPRVPLPVSNTGPGSPARHPESAPATVAMSQRAG